MRTMLRNFGFCCLAALSVGTSYANAQSGYATGDWVDPSSVQAAPQSFGNALGVAGRSGSSVQLFNGKHFLPLPGRVWFEANVGDGLGYEGTYFTLGGKTHLADDFLDGRWLMETQGHVSENGGFFGNLGVERVFSLKRHGADITLGGWLDYDGDEYGGFGHSYWQGAVNGSIRTDRWDLVANGYLPLSETVYTQGSLSGISFFQNNIALQAGLDTALQGFDVTFRGRPVQVANYNGFFDVGAYGYESDAVPYFTGARVRTGMQLANGWRVSGEVNRDDVFEWTGVLQIAYVWGANDRGTYSGLGNDLDPTMRNDHIVRFQQDLVVAVDPDTGAAYNVIHVDNTATGPGTGTFEDRFSTMAQAEAASGTDDIIFVYRGDGTTTNYDTGFVMQDRQFLFGEGVSHIIPVVGGGGFIELPNVVDGNRPVITNVGGPAVTIAGSDTIIRGFEIDGSGPATFMNHGIFANGLLNPINNFRIEDVLVHDADLDGIHIENAAGDIDMVRIEARENSRDGIAISQFGTSDSDIAFRDITVASNLRDGIHLDTFDAATLQFDEEILANGNLRDGVHIANFANTSGTGLAFSMVGHTFQNNVRDGLRLSNVDGNFLFQDLTSINNGADGLSLINVRNTNPLHQTLITSSSGNTSLYSGNAGRGISIDLNDPGSIQRVLIEQSVINGNLVGINAEASGIGTFLTTNVINNISIAGNLQNGVNFRAIDGALHNAVLTNTAIALTPLNMVGNGANAGDGVGLFAGDLTSTNAATLNALVENIDLSGTGGSSIFGATGNLGVLNATINNVTADSSVQSFTFDFGATNPALISRVSLTNSTGSNPTNIAMLVNNAAGSSVDFLVDNVDFRDDAPTIGEAGVLVTNFGNLRLNFTNNNVNNFDNFGMVVQTGGFGRTLGNFAGNTISGNGALNVVSGPGAEPHEDGIRFVTAGSGSANIRFVNNVVTGNFQQGLNLITNGASSMNFLMDTNVISGNDIGDDGTIVTLLVDEMTATNAVGSTMCLALSSNAFGGPGATFVNNSGAAAGTLELDGLTNGIGAITAVNFTAAPFGSTCEPAIAAEEAAFDALGF